MYARMLIPVSPSDLGETNLLLRALWAELRLEYGKLAWQCNPFRDGKRNTIHIGSMDLGLLHTGHFEVTYKKRGVADALVFYIDPEQHPRLEGCVARAVALVRNPKRFISRISVLTSPGIRMADTAGKSIDFTSTSEQQFALTIFGIRAFDKIDASAEFLRRAKVALDALSFLTNVSFRTTAHEELARQETESASASDDGTTRQTAPALNGNWIDGYPIVNNRLAISPEGLQSLDELVQWPISAELGMLADAAHHFHSGLVLEAGARDHSMVGVNAEQAMVQYISALEAASLIGAAEPTPCSTCGQAQHRISARVTEFVHTRIGPHAARVIKQLYSCRSTYLHRGALLSSRSYVGTTMPQLDPSTLSGILTPFAMIPLLNLREWTSYCLRSLRLQSAASGGES